MKTNMDAKYYYIINNDLKMSKGKIASQVSHVAMMLGVKYGEIGRAIVLKASEKLLNELACNINVVFVKDAGLTEVPAGSLTCVGFKSIEYTDVAKLIEKLKLV